MSSGPERPLPPSLTDEMRAAVLDNLSDGVYFVDRQRRILYWNAGAERITGFSAEQVVGRCCKDRILNHCDEAGTQLCGSACPLLDTIRDGDQREAHLFLHHRDGHMKPVRVRAAAIRDQDGNVIGAVETFHEDSALLASRQQAASLRTASTSDPLTEVGNRRMGEATLAGLIEHQRVSGQRFGLLFVDVDRFKLVNDRFGHAVGDEALRVMARTLQDTSRQQDLVIRWGGEEFLVLLPDVDETALRSVAERLRTMVGKTRLFAERRRVQLTISIGATLSAPGDTAEMIVQRADALQYRSKHAGRDRITLES